VAAQQGAGQRRFLLGLRLVAEEDGVGAGGVGGDAGLERAHGEQQVLHVQVGVHHALRRLMGPLGVGLLAVRQVDGRLREQEAEQQADHGPEQERAGEAADGPLDGGGQLRGAAASHPLAETVGVADRALVGG